MPIYIAMLRGINVSGHKLIKMERLRASLETLDCSDVRTYVQSGNVVFKTSKKVAADVAKMIEKNILDDFGFAVPVLLRTPAELGEILKRNPLVKQTAIDDAGLYITFLSQPAPTDAAQLLEPLATASEQLFVAGREIYLCCPNSYGNTKVSNAAIEKKLAVQATTRNWRTVNILFEMAQS
jgi:uncharacterized protein (DUF1697 family)